MIIEDVVGFLKTVPPFQFLDGDTLAGVVNDLSLEFYPRNTVILTQEGPAADALRIIRKGGVRISLRSAEGEETVIDYRGEGDSFGLLSLMGKERQRTTVAALEDTVCYLLAREPLYRLINAHPEFTEHALQSHFARYLSRTYGDAQVRSLFAGSSDHLLLTTRAGEIATRKIAAIGESESVRAAAEAMARHRISSIIVQDRAGGAVGIVTDRDLREKVVAAARDYGTEVREIMSSPIITVDERDSCFEAVLTMIRKNIHHIAVTRDGRLGGVLTNHDLMLLQGSSPLSLAKEIGSQHDRDGLAAAAGKVNSLAGLLIKDGARAVRIAGMLTEMSDRLVRKVLELAEERLGPPPVPYCWIAAGGEGRQEEVFRTEQRYAVVHGDAAAGADDQRLRRYFAEFQSLARQDLAQAGFPAFVPASGPPNPLSRTGWQEAFIRWTELRDREALAPVRVWFDLRPVHGDARLAEDLRDGFLARTRRDGKAFLGSLAELAVRTELPLGFLRDLVVDREGMHREGLDLGTKGVELIADLVRIMALEQGLRETGTLARLDALAGKHPLAKEFGVELGQAFELLTQLRVHRQYQQAAAGDAATGVIEPHSLTGLERLSVRESFQLIGRVQEAAGRRYLGRFP